MRSVRPGRDLSFDGITSFVRDPHMATPSSGFALLAHRLLVPEPDVIPVRVFQIGAIAPERLLRPMDELYAGRRQLLVLGFDVTHLERQHAARSPRASRGLGEKQGEA